MIAEYKIIANSLERFTQQSADKDSLQVVEDLQSLTARQAAFEFVDNKLCLHLKLDTQLTHLSFDLAEGEVGFRASRVSKSNEVVAKALGVKPHYRPRVLDATAGMGRDAFIMAMLGCEVTMQERNFAIYHLLKDALHRLSQNESFLDVYSRLHLNETDSKKMLTDHKEFDVVYLDPMFPERKKSALVKKEMRLFKLLAGEDLDADQLLVNAMNTAAKRVVVKRPKGAPILADKKPTHEIVAKKFRYDVYLNNH